MLAAVDDIILHDVLGLELADRVGGPLLVLLVLELVDVLALALVGVLALALVDVLHLVRARVVRDWVDVAIHMDAWDELLHPGLVGLVGLALAIALVDVIALALVDVLALRRDLELRLRILEFVLQLVQLFLLLLHLFLQLLHFGLHKGLMDCRAIGQLDVAIITLFHLWLLEPRRRWITILHKEAVDQGMTGTACSRYG